MDTKKYIFRHYLDVTRSMFLHYPNRVLLRSLQGRTNSLSLHMLIFCIYDLSVCTIPYIILTSVCSQEDFRDN